MKSAVESGKPQIVRSLGHVAACAGSAGGRHGHEGRGLACDNFLSLPAWFPADKAAAVLRSKGKRFALVGNPNGTTFVADLQELVCAPATKSVSWCAIPLGPAVAPTASLNEVLRVMDAHGNAYLPVVVGGVIVGIVERDVALMRATRPATMGRIAA